MNEEMKYIIAGVVERAYESVKEHRRAEADQFKSGRSPGKGGNRRTDRKKGISSVLTCDAIVTLRNYWIYGIIPL